MNDSRKVCTHDKVIVVFNAEKEKYLNYETSTSGSTIGNVCVCCHDSESLDFFGVPKNCHCTNGGYVRVSIPEMIELKENAKIKIIVDEEGHLLAHGSSNTLPTDTSYPPRSGISFQMNAKGKRKANYCTNLINHIMSTCQNVYLCKHNVRIDSQIASKIKRVLAYNIINENKDELMENEAQVNVITTIDHIVNEPNSTKDEMYIELVGDTPEKIVYYHIVNEPNSTKDEMQIELVGETPVKIVYDSKWMNDYSTGYEVREENNYSIKREHDILFYGTDSKCPKLFIDVNNV